MSAPLPFLTTELTCDGTVQEHTFNAECTGAVIQAVDASVNIGESATNLSWTLAATEKLMLDNRNLANRVLYYQGTAAKLVQVIEQLRRAD